jgi:hypothetical protein
VIGFLVENVSPGDIVRSPLQDFDLFETEVCPRSTLLDFGHDLALELSE